MRRTDYRSVAASLLDAILPFVSLAVAVNAAALFMSAIVRLYARLDARFTALSRGWSRLFGDGRDSGRDLVCSEEARMTVSLAPWSYRYRAVEAEWPRPSSTLAQIWARPFPVSDSQRRSWAVLLGDGSLAGRVTAWPRSTTLVQISIYLAPALYGRGVGTQALLLLVEQLFADGYEFISLYVSATNPRAVRAYRSVGFSYALSHWEPCPPSVSASDLAELVEDHPSLAPYIDIERCSSLYFSMSLSADALPFVRALQGYTFDL